MLTILIDSSRQSMCDVHVYSRHFFNLPMKEAGQFLNELARHRRRKVDGYVWGAVLLLTICASLIFFYCLDGNRSLLSAWNVIYKLGIILSITLLVLAGGWLRREGYAKQGADGEKLVFEHLKPLYENFGWSYQLNLEIPDLNGDIDHIAISPSGRTYCIDVKNHKLSKHTTHDEKNLRRLAGKVMQQALLLRRHMNIPHWVEAIICFTEAHRHLEGEKWVKIQSAYITCAIHVRELLLELEQGK